MSYDRHCRELCREILNRFAHFDRLCAIGDELRAMGDVSAAIRLECNEIRFEHATISNLADQLHLPPLTLTRDVAAFARAQLGLPLDAPAPAPKRPRVARPASWERDLRVYTDSTPSGAPAA